MNNKKRYLLVLLLMVILLTGCTKVMRDSDNNIVKNPDTGQAITANVLCKPSKKVLHLYEENGVDISNLPDCKNFKVNSGGYEGLWTSGFVKPLAWLLVRLGTFFKNYGVAILVITLIIRGAMYPITKKTLAQSESMKKVKPLMEKIEKKYKGKENDRQAMMLKSQEMMAVYKENNIKPLSGCLFALVQIPLFFAFYEALMRLPIILEGSFGPFKLGITPGTAIQNGQWWYLIVCVLVVVVTYFSFKMTSMSMSEDQAKQMKMMANIFVVVIAVTSFSIAVSIALYWITSSGFTILQNFLVKRGKKHA